MAVETIISKVLATSVLSMVQMLLLTACGVLAALRPKSMPLLSPGNVRVVARLTNDIFMPAWTVSSVGSQINREALARDWPLLLAGFATVALGFLIADMTRPLFRPIESLVPAMRVCIAQCNALAVPLVLMHSLCEARDFNEPFDGDADECYAATSADVGIFMVAWQACLWTYTYATLENSQRDESPVAGDALSVVSPTSKYKRYLRLLFLQPNMIGLLCGLFIGLTPLRGYLFRQSNPTPARPIGAAIEIVGSPFVCSLVFVMAAALVHGYLKRASARREKRAARRMLHLTLSRSLSRRALPFRRQGSTASIDDPERGDGDLDELATSTTVASERTTPSVSSSRRSIKHLFDAGRVKTSRSFSVASASDEETASLPRCHSTFAEDSKECPVSPDYDDAVSPGPPEIKEDCCKQEAPPSDDGTPDFEDDKPRFVATALWFILAKLVFVPAVAYALLSAFGDATFGLSKHSRIIVLIEFVAPSAQTIITILYALGLGDIAQSLAPYYFLQYIVSIFTMTAFVAWAIFMLYH